MHGDASYPTAADERPRPIIIGLIVWVLLQVPRLIAIPLIQGVLDGTESDAWMFPAILDIVVAVAAPFMAVALWRARGLWVWVTAIVFFTVSIVDHLDAITAGLLAPAPQVFGGGSGPSPAVVPGLQMLIDIVALWLLLRQNVKRHYLDTTSRNDGERDSGMPGCGELRHQVAGRCGRGQQPLEGDSARSATTLSTSRRIAPLLGRTRNQ